MLKALTKCSVKGRKILFILQSLTIRWIGNYKTIFFRVMQVFDVSFLKMYQMIHSRLSGIASCDLNYRTVQIISLNVHLDIVLNQIICLINRVIPDLFRYNIHPGFSCKRTIHSRSNIGCHHSRFNRKCSTSTKWIYQDPVFIPRCQHNK